MRLGPDGLLEYNAEYGVLICRECQYAVQKNALGSHLLRHKIYREDRHQLLASIELLRLHDPEDVPVPNPESPAVEAIPVISGHACAVDGCAYLCASSKRMRRHWTAAHGSEPLEPISRPATFQTFFRGTKLRYFEIVSSAPAAATSSTRSSTNGGQSATLSSPADLPSLDIDLETLTYFHHFLTTTSPTLPEQSPHIGHFWHKEVIPLALKHKWLMAGVLATSAFYLSIMLAGAPEKEAHKEKYVRLSFEFRSGWEAMDRLGYATMDLAVLNAVKKAHHQVDCLLNCAEWAFAESYTLQELPFDLELLMRNLHDLAYPERPQTESDQNANHRPKFDGVLFRAGRVHGTNEPQSVRMPSTILNSLRVLPQHMAEIFGKPEPTMEALSPVIAFGALADCCETSYSSDNESAAWIGMTTWLAEIPDSFYNFISRRDPATLVVLAYWAAFLVGRAEAQGCWFVRGLRERMLMQISQHLVINKAARSLVTELMK